MSKLSPQLLHFISQDPPKAGTKHDESTEIEIQTMEFIKNGGQVEKLGTTMRFDPVKLSRADHLKKLSKERWNTTNKAM